MTFVVGNTASLDEEALLAISMSIHPNPANSFFVVTYEMPAGMEGEVSILDATGRQIQSTGVIGSNEMTIDASELSAGMYFVTLQSNKLVKTERLVISSNK